MELTPDQAADAVERHDCPTCEVSTADPGPAAEPIRIGYARCSTKGQELDSQMIALHAVGCSRIFSEKISTRVKVRPELEAALGLCRDIKSAAPGQNVIFCVHELKRPARNAAELMTLASGLQAAGIQLELLSGPLTGIYDPNGLGAMLFAVLAVAAQLDRDYIRDKTLEGQQAAAARGNHGGRPKVIDEDMLTFALVLRAKGVAVPDIAKKLIIKTDANAGNNPSVASVYRALADADADDLLADQAVKHSAAQAAIGGGDQCCRGLLDGQIPAGVQQVEAIEARQ